MESKLCTLCYKLVQSFKIPTLATNSQWLLQVPFHSIQEVREGINRYCSLCTLVQGEFSHALPNGSDWEAGEKSGALCEVSVKDESKLDFLLHFHNTAFDLSFEFHCRHVSDSKKEAVAQRRHLAPNTGSDITIIRCAEWLSTCQMEHKLCGGGFKGSIVNLTDTWKFPITHRTHEARILPSRLLFLEDPFRLCTTEKLPSETQYATLSHCWGSEPLLQLRTSTLHEFQQQLPLDQFPRTFSDALKLAVKLGFFYIWIDSLCIIQDSIDDWQKEAVLMSRVYANSGINISAAASENGAGGLFRDRHPAAVEACYIRAENFRPDPSDSYESNSGKVRRFLSRKSDRGNAELYEICPLDIYERGVLEAPLGRRAWALQERFLAPRTLHFGQQQVFWECLQEQNSETQVVLKYPKLLPIKLFGAMFGISREDAWSTFVQEYSRCQLTKPEDKLVALSGVAKWIYNRFGGDYVCGHWREDLPASLAWNILERASEPEHYRAPSWSWASVEGKLVFAESDTGFTSVSTVLSIDLKLLTADKYGQIESAILHLRCPRLLPLNECGAYDFPEQPFLPELDPTNSVCSNSHDCMFCALLIVPTVPIIGEKYGRFVSWSVGIIVQKVGTVPGRFRRTGTFQAFGSGKSWPPKFRVRAEKAPRSINDDQLYAERAGTSKKYGEMFIISLV